MIEKYNSNLTEKDCALIVRLGFKQKSKLPKTTVLYDSDMIPVYYIYNTCMYGLLGIYLVRINHTRI